LRNVLVLTGATTGRGFTVDYGSFSMSETWTIGRLLEWTADYLADREADSPRLDAEILLAEARGCKRIDLYAAFAEEADEKVRLAFRELVRRRAEGTPVAYLVGYREFYSLRFRVTPDVLIPRPETELLVVRLLELAGDRPAGKPITIADVGTGSGVIAVCAAKHLPSARVTAVDISGPALGVAKSNAGDHKVSDRVEFFESDLLDAVDADRRFDFILSNPPYVTSDEMQTLAPTVKDHEPQVALVAGTAGTDVIERLVPQAAERLNPGGHLLFEISPMLEQAAQELIDGEGRLERGSIIKDLAGHARVVQARRKM
jgi:release factor glutamine methyltransferase